MVMNGVSIDCMRFTIFFHFSSYHLHWQCGDHMHNQSQLNINEKYQWYDVYLTHHSFV